MIALAGRRLIGNVWTNNMPSRPYRIMIRSAAIGGPALIIATVHAFAVGAVAFPAGLPEEVRKVVSPMWAFVACVSGWIGVIGVTLALACAVYCTYVTREIEDTGD